MPLPPPPTGGRRQRDEEEENKPNRPSHIPKYKPQKEREKTSSRGTERRTPLRSLANKTPGFKEREESKRSLKSLKPSNLPLFSGRKEKKGRRQSTPQICRPSSLSSQAALSSQQKTPVSLSLGHNIAEREEALKEENVPVGLSAYSRWLDSHESRAIKRKLSALSCSLPSSSVICEQRDTPIDLTKERQDAQSFTPSSSSTLAERRRETSTSFVSSLEETIVLEKKPVPNARGNEKREKEREHDTSLPHRGLTPYNCWMEKREFPAPSRKRSRVTPQRPSSPVSPMDVEEESPACPAFFEDSEVLGGPAEVREEGGKEREDRATSPPSLSSASFPFQVSSPEYLDTQGVMKELQEMTASALSTIQNALVVRDKLIQSTEEKERDPFQERVVSLSAVEASVAEERHDWTQLLASQSRARKARELAPPLYPLSEQSKDSLSQAFSLVAREVPHWMAVGHFSRMLDEKDSPGR